jgi:DNA-binding protein YbaB
MAPPPADERRAHAARRLGELAEAERRMAEIERAADEFLDDVTRLRENRLSIHVTQKIGPGLGTLEVDGNGRLTGITLSRHAVAMSDTGILGSRILRALDAARTEASAQYKQELARLARRHRT